MIQIIVRINSPSSIPSRAAVLSDTCVMSMSRGRPLTTCSVSSGPYRPMSFPPGNTPSRRNCRLHSSLSRRARCVSGRRPGFGSRPISPH